MACRTIFDGQGRAIGIVCGGPRAKRCTAPGCGGSASKLCDWKLRTASGEFSGKTCDRGLCDRHAASPAPGKDLCPAHWAQWQEIKAKGAK